MNSRLRRMLFVPVIVLIGVYLCICLYLYFFQNRFLFYPTHDIAVTPDQVGLAYTDQYYELPSGEKIHGWFVPGDSAGPTVLFLHGNGGNVGHRIEHIRLMNSLGVSTLIIDYRGYGRSTGKPSETNLYADAELAYRWLIDSKGVPENRLFVFGESIGGAVAIDLASKQKIAGLIVESSFTSLRQIAQHSFPIVPAGLLLRSEFNSIEKLRQIHVPVLVCHSPYDDIIPYEFGRKLFEAANPPKQFIRLFGGHNDREYLADSMYVSALKHFFAAPNPMADSPS